MVLRRCGTPNCFFRDFHTGPHQSEIAAEQIGGRKRGLRCENVDESANPTVAAIKAAPVPALATPTMLAVDESPVSQTPISAVPDAREPSTPEALTPSARQPTLQDLSEYELQRLENIQRNLKHHPTAIYTNSY